MNIQIRILTLLLLFAIGLPTLLPANQTNHELRDVEVRIFLIDIEKVDTAAQSFTANLTMVTRWQDRKLAHSGPGSKSVSLDKVWHPRIQLINRQNVVSTLPDMVEIHPDGKVVHRQRFWGNFSQPLNLESFPFDNQSLKITLANVGFGEEDVNLKASPASGVSENLTIPDWSIVGWDLTATRFSIEDEPTGLAGLVFSLDVQRDRSFFKYKVIFPLILIVMMSWLVFWIDPSLAASQISVSVTAMLTMIAYRFALSGMVPRLAFLTSLDYFVLASTLVVFLAMIEVVYTAYLSTNGQLSKARRVDFHARWLAPLIYFAAATETLFLRIWV